MSLIGILMFQQARNIDKFLMNSFVQKQDRCYIFCFILLTNKGSRREVYQDFQPSLTPSRDGAMDCLDKGSVHPQPILPNC